MEQYSMAEQNGLSSDINLRNKGLRDCNGHLKKGLVKDAYSKLAIGSIPSNYQSIIYHSESKEGFGSRQRRFNEVTKNVLGLFEEESLREEQHCRSKNVSHSSKGFGSLISKEKRGFYRIQNSPGPGLYLTQYAKDTKQARNSFGSNRKNIRQSRHNLRKCVTREHDEDAARPASRQISTLGPGEYAIRTPGAKNILIGCKSSFLAKGNRDGYIPKSITPGPGFYCEQQQRRIPQQQVQKTEEQSISLEHLMKYGVLNYQREDDSPGPGSYMYNIPSFKPLYQRVKISSNFMQSSKNRFESLGKSSQKQNNNAPQPGSYTIKSDFEQSKSHRADSPCFLSATKRILFSGSNGLDLPIGNVNVTLTKKNFHFNVKKKWL